MYHPKPTRGWRANRSLRDSIRPADIGLSRFVALVLSVLLLPVLVEAGAAARESPVRWHRLDPKAGLEGRGWSDTRHPFDRLPAKAEGVVRAPVWALAQDSAGMRFRFVTDAESLQARWTLRKPDRQALPHMPATGVSGLDLYFRDVDSWRWLAVGVPEKAKDNERVLERVLVSGLKKAKREYLLYLPLYNGVDSLEIGLPEGAVFEAAPARYHGRPPIVFYGTSILQGGCASRPGMAYPSILGRKLDWPTVNLGFSGNGRSEPEMATLVAELDAAAFVIDSLPNLDPTAARERIEPFIQTLRSRHPTTPIVMVENIDYANAALVEARQVKVVAVNRHLRDLYKRLKAAGDSRLYYVPSTHLLGGDGEDTVDGTHPTDLGFLRMAEGMEPVLRTALGEGGFSVPSEEGFVSLFDGETLSGWKRHDGMPPIHRGAKWWVEDGVLLGDQDPPGTGGLLWLDRPFADFILKLQIQLKAPMDTGVFLRVGPTALSHQVCIDYRPGSDVGAIFIPFVGHSYVSRFSDGARFVNPEGWNDVEIRMEGEPARIRVWLNSRLLTDFQHTAVTTRGLPRKGGLALQVHPDVAGMSVWKAGNPVRVRNIRIKELGQP